MSEVKKLIDMDAAGTLVDADLLLVKQTAVTGGRKLTLAALWTWIVLKITANAAAVRSAAGLGDLATQSASAVAISGGTASGLTLSTATVSSLTAPLSVANGGTGAASASAARTALGAAASGVNSDITQLSAVTRVASGTSTLTVGPATTAGSDSAAVVISASGALSSARGAYFVAYGAQAGSPGRLALVAGDTGYVSITGRLDAGGVTVIDASGLHQHRSYTVATLPTASPAGRSIYVSDGTSNKRFAVSDGSAWRWPDGAVVS